MKRFSLICVFCILIIKIFSQDNANENILYIVDSIPIIEEPKGEDSNLDNSDIDEINIIINKDTLKKIGYSKYDKLIFVFTKAYKARHDSLKRIITTKILKNESGIWYMKTIPYSGRFIDYFINGKISAEGYMKNGLLNGHQIRYRRNGSKSIESNFVNGKHEANYKEFHYNGVLSQEGTFENDKEVGIWNDYYSTGKLKRSYTYKNGQVDISKQDKKYYDLLKEGFNDYFKIDNYKGAIKRYNKAISINSNYSDAYFYRGTAKLYNFDFDGAILDLDTAILLEPLYAEAIANRAFCRIRKYEFKDSRTLGQNESVTIMATKNNVMIPPEALNMICIDLNKAIELGNRVKMITDALEKYCNKK